MDSLAIDAPLRIPPGRHTLAPDEVARLQRERLLRSVTACAAEAGYRATTIGDVVARAEVSRSAFYDQFESKEDCFLAAYAQSVRGPRALATSRRGPCGAPFGVYSAHNSHRIGLHPAPALAWRLAVPIATKTRHTPR